jgi:hypothetical protein
MDALIQSVALALGTEGVTIAAIHDSIIEKGWSEQEAFLAIKAGENLYNARINLAE